MAGSSKKGRLAMLQFYKLIIAKVEAERVAHEDRISNLSKAGKKKMNEKRARKFPKLAKDAKDAVDAVNAVSDEIAFAISDRMKGFQINFESQLLLMYFTKLIFVLGLGDGFDASLLTATKVLTDLLRQLDKVISNRPGGVAWKDVSIGQLGFLRSKHQRYKSAVNSLVLMLDLRLQKAMTKINPEIRAKDRAKLPPRALKIIQEYAKNDAKAILETLGKKKNRTSKVEAILKRMIHPLAKNIFIPSESVPQYKKIPEMSLAQLVILRTHLAKVISDLDNLGQAIQFSKKPKQNSRTTRMKFSSPPSPPHKMMTKLHLIYDPETQRGLILRLRVRLGQHFELCFKPIGANGDEEEEEEEEEEIFPLLSLPAELVNFITMFLIKISPTAADTEALFSFARSDPAVREFIEHPSLERMVSENLLGASHSRSREERRLGLEPNVAQRYRRVLKTLGLRSRVSALQEIADRNAEKYKVGGSIAYLPFITAKRPDLKKEEEESSSSKKRIKVTGRISSWPWWYLRLMSNRASLYSMTNRFTFKSDAFSASIVSVEVLKPVMKRRRPPKQFKLRTFTDADPKSSMSGPEGIPLLLRLGSHGVPDAADWQIWTSGADLTVIPMKELIRRAAWYGRSIDQKMKLNGPIHLMISAAEPMRLENPRAGRASFRKEIVMTGLEEMANTIRTLTHYPKASAPVIKNYNVNLSLQIQDAYLGKQWTEFLGHQRGARAYLHLEQLILQHVYFEDMTPLDLSGITGGSMTELGFGPTNLPQVPNFCPAPELAFIELRTEKDDILIWDIPDDPAACLPLLSTLAFRNDIQIWKAPEALEKFSKFPKLKYLILDGFRGNAEDLQRLGGILEQAPKAKSNSGITVIVGLGEGSGNAFNEIIFKFLYTKLNATFEGVFFESRD